MFSSDNQRMSYSQQADAEAWRKELCIRCERNPRIKDARFPNAKLCNECFLSALTQLMNEADAAAREGKAT